MGVQEQNDKLMKLKKSIYYGFLLLLFLVLESCKSTKLFPADTPKKNVDFATLTSQLQRVQPSISNLTARIKAQYNDGKRKQQIIVQLRMASQKKIWMSATMLVPIAKLLIEEDQVSFYEKFQKTYFQGDFNLINAPLGTRLNLEQLEQLFLAKPLVPLSKGDWKLISHPEDYVLVSKVKKSPISITLFFDSSTFLLKEQRVLIPGTANTLSIKYENHTRVNDQYFPQKIVISFFDGKQLQQLDLEFSRITLPKELTFPFVIPKGYKELEL